jgi:hypothetical protein
MLYVTLSVWAEQFKRSGTCTPGSNTYCVEAVMASMVLKVDPSTAHWILTVAVPAKVKSMTAVWHETTALLPVAENVPETMTEAMVLVPCGEVAR